jgi:ABC-type sugar transport system substrate-binding protein
VTECLEKAAKEAGGELLVLDNDFDEETAVANAEEFIAKTVDLVIEFHAHQPSAAHIAHRLAEAIHSTDNDRYPAASLDLLWGGQLSARLCGWQASCQPLARALARSG